MGINKMPQNEGLRIYLCGSVKKGVGDDRTQNEFWCPEHEEKIHSCVSAKVTLLNPSKTNIQRSDYFLNFGCDMQLVASSDFLIADLRSGKGIGVGAELMFAHQSRIPVISWLPEKSHYRRDLSDVFGEDLENWIHPFAFSLSDHIEVSLEDICHKINLINQGALSALSSQRSISQAKAHYLKSHPVQQL